MKKLLTQTSTPEEMVSVVLRQLNEGQIQDVIDSFADVFRFRDLGIGLEFADKARLAEFFRKTRDLYPDYLLQRVRTFVSDEHVIIEWSVHVTVTEPFNGGLFRKVPLSFNGISVVRVDNGKIAEWSDYYDGLTARRTALAAHFTEWIEA